MFNNRRLYPDSVAIGRFQSDPNSNDVDAGSFEILRSGLDGRLMGRTQASDPATFQIYPAATHLLQLRTYEPWIEVGMIAQIGANRYKVEGRTVPGGRPLTKLIVKELPFATT